MGCRSRGRSRNIAPTTPGYRSVNFRLVGRWDRSRSGRRMKALPSHRRSRPGPRRRGPAERYRIHIGRRLAPFPHCSGTPPQLRWPLLAPPRPEPIPAEPRDALQPADCASRTPRQIQRLPGLRVPGAKGPRPVSIQTPTPWCVSGVERRVQSASEVAGAAHLHRQAPDTGNGGRAQPPCTSAIRAARCTTPLSAGLALLRRQGGCSRTPCRGQHRRRYLVNGLQLPIRRLMHQQFASGVPGIPPPAGSGYRPAPPSVRKMPAVRQQNEGSSGRPRPHTTKSSASHSIGAPPRPVARLP